MRVDFRRRSRTVKRAPGSLTLQVFLRLAGRDKLKRETTACENARFSYFGRFGSRFLPTTELGWIRCFPQRRPACPWGPYPQFILLEPRHDENALAGVKLYSRSSTAIAKVTKTIVILTFSSKEKAKSERL